MYKTIHRLTNMPPSPNALKTRGIVLLVSSNYFAFQIPKVSPHNLAQPPPPPLFTSAKQICPAATTALYNSDH